MNTRSTITIQKRIVQGMSAAIGAAAATYGPAGWTVAIHRNDGQLQSTKCGATVLQTFSLQDPFEDAGAHLLAQIAMQIRKHAGDGSTVGALIAQAVAVEAFNGKMMTNELSELSGMIRSDAELVEGFLRRSSAPATDSAIRSMALSAAGHDEQLSEVVCEAFSAADGPDAVFLLGHNNGAASLDLVEGIQLKSHSPDRLAVPETALDLEKVNLVLRAGPICDWADIEPSVPRNGRPTLVLAEKILPPFRRAAAAHGQDAPVYCAEVLGSARHNGVQQLEAISRAFHQNLCYAKQTPGPSEIAQARVLMTNKKVMLCAGSITVTDDQVLASLKRRASIVALTGLIEPVSGERLERAAQCIAAVQAAMQGGVVAGGGAALADAARWLGAQTVEGRVAQRGREILCHALLAPMRALVNSAGHLGDLETRKHLAGTTEGLGFDVVTERFVPAVQAGIVTPLYSIVAALRVASSIVGLVLLTEALAEEKHVRNARLQVFRLPEDLN